MSGVGAASRRGFLKLCGGSLLVWVASATDALHAQPVAHPYPQDFNAYFLIAPDGRVTVYTGKIEMGQGAMTSQAQMVAEELGVDLAAIDMVMGDTASCPWDMGTFGSLTTRMFGPVLRAAAAQAHAVLGEIAAAQLGAESGALESRGGVVWVRDEPSRRLTYGQLARGATVPHGAPIPGVVLRAATQFEVMGTSARRLDGHAKVTGAAKYAADIRLPGMLYAQLLRPPAHGAELLRLDTRAAEQRPGVTVVRRPEWVAVLHADPYAAAQALASVQAEWAPVAPAPDADHIFEYLVAHAPGPQELVRRGDPAAAKDQSTSVFEATYQKGYVAHAAMETHAALAQVDATQATVWASTQTPFPTRDRVAQALGLAVERVRVITPFLGGGFGGKSADAQALEAALLAQVTGRPVQVAWSRAEEFFFDTFDPAAVVQISSGCNARGQVSAWDATVFGAGERGASVPYEFAHVRVRTSGRAPYGPQGDATGMHPFAVGPWRGPGANMNVFAIESQMDTMASALGVDPLEFRLRHLADARMRRVLEAAAQAFGWTPAAAPSGRGVGVACVADAGSYVATMAEVRVDARTGFVRVLRMVCAQDMGQVVNPQGARMQVEGGLTMGLGYALSEELRFRGGEILDRNFDTYRFTRFSDVPRIEVVLVANDALAPQGAGEPAILTTGAVVANAVFDATGARVMRLPLSADRVRSALPARPGQPSAAALRRP